MPLLKTLSRSLRARDDDSASDPYSDELEASSPSILDTGDGDDDSAQGFEEDVDDVEGSNEESDEGFSEVSEDDFEDHDNEDVQNQLTKVSLGALAQAHAQLQKDDIASKKRKRGHESSADTEAKLKALRERLRELREVKKGRNGVHAKSQGSRTDALPEARKIAKRQRSPSVSSGDSQSDFDSNSDSAPDAAKPTKRSKHAPTAQSTNKAVSRKRNVVSSGKPASARSRDPRFLATAGPRASSEKLSKSYAFLNDYRQSEIAALKEQLGEAGKGKKNKNQKRKSKGGKLSEEERAQLKRDLTRMESQEQARKERERLEQVMSRHKKGERDKVAQGKKTWFLKKSEQKRLALVDKFEEMKGKQRDRAIEKRRKKNAAKERKAMPAARRVSAGARDS